MAVLTPKTVYAPGVMPAKSQIIQLLEQIMGSSSAPSVVKETKAALDLVTPASETYGGLVLNDPDATKNGYYYRSAAVWVKGRGFPDTFAVLTSIGGTANAITASTEATVNPADVLCVLLPDPPGTNSSSTVTLTLNGGSAENVKAASGANLAIGDIIDGVGTLFFKVGSEWRQLFSSATGATFDHQGDYVALTTYTEGQVVTGSDGKWYQLKDPSATGDDPVGSVTGAWLQILAAAAVADGSVTTIKIADSAVTEPKHATGGVSTRALAAGAATLVKIGDDAKADFRLVDPNGPRIPVAYYSATQVEITGVRSIAMGGFRFKGRYKVGRAPVFDMPAFDSEERHIIDLGNGTSTAGDLFAEAWHVKSNWYAQFAAANDGDATATLGSMPFLRVGSIAGSVVTLNQGGENQRSIAGKTYQFATNALVGAEVLVITETLNSRANAFSGRLTTVTANTGTTVTLADVGAMAAYDYFLIAPPGFDHYCYLNACYMDTAEVRNIADSGDIVKSKGIYLLDQSTNGDKSAGVFMTTGGYISPLATRILMDSSATLSTSSTGQVAEYFDMDGGNHVEYTGLYQKNSSGNESYVFPAIDVAFSFYPQFEFSTGGSLQANRINSQLNVTGWYEG
ncbi:hypothetical protein [Devosia sp. Naph2]|uniref:hypothetical protein n=1 Tax=Devosia polycyclovorans TaxID=3345148 RepID=UPI0035CF9FC4